MMHSIQPTMAPCDIDPSPVSDAASDSECSTHVEPNRYRYLARSIESTHIRPSNLRREDLVESLEDIFVPEEPGGPPKDMTRENVEKAFDLNQRSFYRSAQMFPDKLYVPTTVVVPMNDPNNVFKISGLQSEFPQESVLPDQAEDYYLMNGGILHPSDLLRNLPLQFPPFLAKEGITCITAREPRGPAGILYNPQAVKIAPQFLRSNPQEFESFPVRAENPNALSDQYCSGSTYEDLLNALEDRNTMSTVDQDDSCMRGLFEQCTAEQREEFEYVLKGLIASRNRMWATVKQKVDCLEQGWESVKRGTYVTNRKEKFRQLALSLSKTQEIFDDLRLSEQAGFEDVEEQQTYETIAGILGNAQQDFSKTADWYGKLSEADEKASETWAMIFRMLESTVDGNDRRTLMNALMCTNSQLGTRDQIRKAVAWATAKAIEDSGNPQKETEAPGCLQRSNRKLAKAKQQNLRLHYQQASSTPSIPDQCSLWSASDHQIYRAQGKRDTLPGDLPSVREVNAPDIQWAEKSEGTPNDDSEDGSFLSSENESLYIANRPLPQVPISCLPKEPRSRKNAAYHALELEGNAIEHTSGFHKEHEYENSASYKHGDGSCPIMTPAENDSTSPVDSTYYSEGLGKGESKNNEFSSSDSDATSRPSSPDEIYTPKGFGQVNISSAMVHKSFKLSDLSVAAPKAATYGIQDFVQKVAISFEPTVLPTLAPVATSHATKHADNKSKPQLHVSGNPQLSKHADIKEKSRMLKERVRAKMHSMCDRLSFRKSQIQMSSFGTDKRP